MNLDKRRWKDRWRWLLLVSAPAFLLVAAWVWWWPARRPVAQWQLLRQIAQIERAGVDQATAQTRGWSLAILGRDDEIRRMEFFPQPASAARRINFRSPDLHPVPWRAGLAAIAREHRIVMIMEDHFVSQHREMVGATLPLFKEAGFTHYAAEAIQEPAGTLMARGFPAVETGLYTSDPRFGNLLRRALDLRFTVIGYDFGRPSHEAREESAATELARLIRNQPPSKLLVHAGFAHVFKHPTDTGQRWLASLLWEKTGVEPFTIWQWSDTHDATEYRSLLPALRERLGDFREPVLLMPPPSREHGGDVPDVDAILVHPPDGSIAPAQRTVLFPESTRRISGQWLTEKWPVIVAAFRKGEPVTAIPLDQVMLRTHERDFALWIPRELDFEIVVFDEHGVLPSATDDEHDAHPVQVRAAGAAGSHVPKPR